MEGETTQLAKRYLMMLSRNRSLIETSLLSSQFNHLMKDSLSLLHLFVLPLLNPRVAKLAKYKTFVYFDVPKPPVHMYHDRIKFPLAILNKL